MAILLMVAVTSIAFLTLSEFVLSREPRQSQEHRALVLKLRKRIALKRNRPRVLFIYQKESIGGQKEYELQKKQSADRR
jgi:hypothetical protein